MHIKTITAREAEKTFDEILDTVQHRPVIITSYSKPTLIMVSITDLLNVDFFIKEIKKEQTI